jgi:beta-phosphoglucomutase-like phosphatase (HAD superfamily)
MVEALGVDPKACVYLDDIEVDPKPTREMGMTTVKVLNAAQVIGEIEMAKGLALRTLLAKNAVSEWELLTRQPQARQAYRKVCFARVNSINIRPA